jgi:hypothetical protein
MALLSTQVPTVAAGLVPSFASAAASDTFAPSDRTFLYVKNTNASTRTITVTTPGTAAGGLAIADMVGTVGATTGELILGPFPYQNYADPTTGVATVTPSATAGVTYAVVQLQVT